MALGGFGESALSTGCSTCKTRHKKCDEARPACSACVRMGWKCDFESSSPPERLSPPIRGLQYPSARPLLDGEHACMEYFQVICAGEFSLFFEVPDWENIILQGTLAEPALHHAALAIRALTRGRYHPEIWQTTPAVSFSIGHYGMAIQDLYRRLDGSSQSLELAVLTSVVFSLIEFLLGLDSQVEMHIRAGCFMLENLYARNHRSLTVSTEAGSSFQDGSPSPLSHDLLANAMSQLTAQVNSLVAFQSDSNS